METPIKFKIQSKLCETTSSTIYKGILLPGITPVIIKMDKVTAPITTYLLNETKMRRFLEKVQCIPKLLDYGIYNNKRYIVYPFIPETLQYHRFYTDTSLYTSAYQLLTMVENIHKYGIYHQNISPTRNEKLINNMILYFFFELVINSLHIKWFFMCIYQYTYDINIIIVIYACLVIVIVKCSITTWGEI